MLGRLQLPSNVTALPLAASTNNSCMATLPSSLMAMRSLLGSSASYSFAIIGCYHGQLAHRETCSARFTTKWAP